MVIDEADQGAIQEMAGQHRRQQTCNQTCAAIKGDGRKRPDREHRQYAGDRRREGRNPFDVLGGGMATSRDERKRGNAGIQQRRHGHVLAVRRGIRIRRDTMREVAHLALGEPHVVPRVGLEKIDASTRAGWRAEHVIPRRPHPQACGDRQDGDQHDKVEFAHRLQILSTSARHRVRGFAGCRCVRRAGSARDQQHARPSSGAMSPHRRRAASRALRRAPPTTLRGTGFPRRRRGQ